MAARIKAMPERVIATTYPYAGIDAAARLAA
jgi:hypothetical protein